VALLRYVCSLPNPGTKGAIRELFYPDNPEGRARAEKFAQHENKPGRGVYDCIGRLQDGARSRCKDTVADLDQIVADLDLKNITQRRDAVLQCVKGLVLPPSEIRDSGFGLHLIWHLKEPVEDDDDLSQAETTMKRLAELLAGDLKPTHRAALLRHPGSDNTKGREPRPCRTIEAGGAAYDISEFDDMFDLYADRPLLTRKAEAAKGNGHDRNSEQELRTSEGRLDGEAALAAMKPTGASVNDTVCRVIPSLLRRGEHPSDVLERVVSAVMEMAKRCRLKWSETVEVQATRKRILSAYNNLLLRDYDPATGDIPGWLPGEYHARWAEVVGTGCRPCFGFNRGGFYIRKAQAAAASRNFETAPGPAQGKPASNRTQAGPSGWHLYDSTMAEPPRWLVKGILPESGVAIIPGQWGSYKTTTALDLALSVMTGRPFAGRYRIKRAGAVVYFALEGAGTLQSRLAAIAKQYDAPATLPFAWRSDCPLLTAKDAGLAITNHCNSAAAYFKQVYGVPTVLILIDTYAVAAGFTLSGDDSDTAATQKAFTALRYVHKHTGAAVVVVDHFGKVMEAGTRGSSNKEGNADAVLATLADKELSGTVSNTRLAVRKQRDGLSGFEIPFTPQVIDLGLDEDGDPVTAVVLDWGVPRKTTGEARKPKDVVLLCSVLAKVVAEKGFPFLPSPGGPSVQACHGDDLRDAFCERRHAGNRKARWIAYSRALRAATAASLIGTRNEEGECFIVWARQPG